MSSENVNFVEEVNEEVVNNGLAGFFSDEADASGKSTVKIEPSEFVLKEINQETGAPISITKKIANQTKGVLAKVKTYAFNVESNWAEKSSALSMFYQEHYSYTEHPLTGINLTQCQLAFNVPTSKGLGYIGHRVQNNQMELPGYKLNNKISNIRFAKADNYYDKINAQVKPMNAQQAKGEILLPVFELSHLIKVILQSRQSRNQMKGVQYKTSAVLLNWAVLNESGNPRTVPFIDTFQGETTTYDVIVIRPELEGIGELYTTPEGEELRVCPVDLRNEKLWYNVDSWKSKTAPVDVNSASFLRRYFRYRNLKIEAAAYFINEMYPELLVDLSVDEKQLCDLWFSYGYRTDKNDQNRQKLGLCFMGFNDTGDAVTGTESWKPVLYKGGNIVPSELYYRYNVVDGSIYNTHIWPVFIKESAKQTKRLPGSKPASDSGDANTAAKGEANFGLGGDGSEMM